MKITIDIAETAYEAFKEWHKNKVATVEQSIIAQGIPYEERPQDNEESYQQGYESGYAQGYIDGQTGERF